MTTEPLHILAPFVPTPEAVVERMLALAEVSSEDLVYDLGCGDGRIIITAAKQRGARGVGVDIEPHWVEVSRANAKRAGVEDLVTFKTQDAITLDLTPASVVMLYLVGWSTRKLQPLIRRMVQPGTRIVSHSFSMNQWAPAQVEECVDDNGNAHTLYLWIEE
jgi:cyclopropane fatty-acyl-phospholipid synthase-like methyltransferase